MAEFSEVIKQFKRMCNNGHCATATGCPMYPSCNIGQCRRIAFERPSDFEQRVMSWAAENPEPQYPTWYRWLIMMNAIGSVEDLFSDLQREIPAVIAQQLGIEPEEG